MWKTLAGFSTTFFQLPACFLTQLTSSDFLSDLPFWDSPPIKFPSTENIKVSSSAGPMKDFLAPWMRKRLKSPQKPSVCLTALGLEEHEPSQPSARSLAALAELAGFPALPCCWAMSLKISGWISTLSWCSFGQTHQEGFSGPSLGDLAFQALVLILLWSLPALTPPVPKGHVGLLNSSRAAKPCPSRHWLQLGGQAEIKQKQQLQLVAAEVLVSICSFRKNVSLFLLY